MTPCPTVESFLCLGALPSMFVTVKFSLTTNGAISAEIWRRVLLIIHVFYCCKCVFCYYIKDIITIPKMDGMGSFNIQSFIFKYSTTYRRLITITPSLKTNKLF